MDSRSLSCFKASPLVLALSLAFPLAAPLAQAAPSVVATGSFVDGSDYLSTAKSGAFDQPVSANAFSRSAFGAATAGYDSSTQVSAAFDGVGNFATAIANSKSYGSFSSMTAATHLVFSDSLLNSTGSTQSASFALNIGQVAFSVFSGAFNGINRASFQASVFVGNAAQPLWSSGFTIDNPNNSNGPVAGSSSGVDIGLGNALLTACSSFGSSCGLFGSASFAINGYSTTLNLGDVAAGNSVSVRYVVDLATETNTYGGVASVSFDDPAHLATGGGAALGFATPVPEPESVALLAAGLGLVAAAARRRRRC